MKAKIVIEVDMETGEYTLKYGSDTKESIDQQELEEMLEKVVANWKLKFRD